MQRDNFRKNLNLQLEDNPRLNGMGDFRRQLERDYYASVSIRNCHSRAGSWNLVIEMTSNLSLSEMLYHLRKGCWGKSSGDSLNKLGPSPLLQGINELKTHNTRLVDIEEISLFLNDVAIIVKKIYQHSVADQFNNILNTMAGHYLYLTRGLDETPYEIYIPVFEEIPFSQRSLVPDYEEQPVAKKDYYGFWALYFDSEEDAVIYDLQGKCLISGDLNMLNH